MATPGDYPTNLTLWLKADAITGVSDGALLTAWPDSSAAGANATSPLAPTYRANVVNGLPAVGFDGTRYMQSTASSSGAAQTVVAVVRPDNLSAVRTIRGGQRTNGSTGGLQFRIDPSGATPSGPALRFVKEGVADIGGSSTPLTATTWYVVTGTWDDSANAFAFTVNGVAAGGGSSAVSLTAGRGTTIGANGSPASGPSEHFVGYIAELASWSRVLSSTELDAVVAGLQAKYLPSGLALTSPTATATAAALPAVLAFSALALMSPTATATAAAAPATVAVGGMALTSPTATATAAALPAGLGFGALALTSPTATATASALPASVFMAGDTITVPVGFTLDVAPVVFDAPGTVASEAVVVPLGFDLDVHPVVSLTPAGAPTTPHALRIVGRHAHVMPALTEASPKYQGGVDYTVDRGPVGDLRVFVGGVDVTYLRGIPVTGLTYSAERPMGPRDASFRLPAQKPWDEPGTGELSMFYEDAPVEIVMRRSDDSLEHVWEGYLAGDEESHGESGVDYFYPCEGVFQQAAHWPWDPPVYMPPTDPAIVVARALNAVPHRRYAKIPEIPSGLEPIEYLGEQGQSTWQYVADIFADAIDENGRQLTLDRVGPLRYWPVLKAAVTAADFTVTKGAPGVDVRLARNYSARRDAIFGRGFAPDGGFWCNRFFPGLKFGNPPAYPMNDPGITLNGLSDYDTSTGSGITTWQRRMVALGYPITVDGVMNYADTYWIQKVQRARGILVDGVLGPQTWAATFEDNNTEADLTTRRLPMARTDDASPYLYSASGAIVGKNPADDPRKIIHAMPEYDFGTRRTKSSAFPLAERILARESVTPYTGTVTLRSDPHEDGTSKLDIREGHNILVVGHHGGVTVQVVTVEVNDNGREVTLTVDSRARDAAIVDAIINGTMSDLRDRAGRNARNDRSNLNDAQVVQYESESQAGYVSRTAVNGNVGLWTVRKVYVSQVGVAQMKLKSSPAAEMVTAIFGRPITPNRIASFSADPLADSDGWYDAIDTLRDKYGLMEVWGGPGNPGGYFPRQKGKGSLTGRQEESGAIPYVSPYGGFVWVAMFTGRSTFVEGRLYPAVPS